MKYFKQTFAVLFFGLLLTVFLGAVAPLHAQLNEPDVRGIDSPQTPVGQGYSNRFGGGLFINNFGIGITGLYSHALGPYTELTFMAGISGIRDVSEQSFTDYFTGQRTVPNKYNRALGFPFMIGLKKRIFPRQIADNFRFFVAASAGPALGLIYPYINDENDNGYRDIALAPNGFTQPLGENKRGFFGGLADSHSEWGAAGQIRIGVDLGGNYKRQSTLEIGYFFYYFDQGLQLMEPFKPAGYQPCFGGQLACPVSLDENGNRVSFFDAQKFFGTPQIKFTFSGWW